MIIKEYYLKELDWSVKIFHAIDTYYIDIILGDLESMGCSDDYLLRVEKLMIDNKNFGLVFSNLPGRHSIILIGETTSLAKYEDIKKNSIKCLLKHISKDLLEQLDEIF